MDSKSSLNYEEALDMLLKSLEKNEVFQLRRHISKLGVFIGGILFIMDLILMGYIISINSQLAAIKASGDTTQQLIINDTVTPVEEVEENVEGIKEETKEDKEEPVMEVIETSKKNLMIEEYQTVMTELLARQECSEDWFKEYKMVIDEYSEILEEMDQPDNLSDVYTADEIALLESCVETETHGGSFKSHVNVANVIFNRIEATKWPGTITGVITQPDQFSYNKVVISESVKLAVEYAFLFPDTTDGATYFNAGSAVMNGNKIFVMTDDIGHSFYKEPDTVIIDDISDDDDAVG